MTENPLLERSALPPFDRIQPAQVTEAVRTVLRRSEEFLLQLEAQANRVLEATDLNISTALAIIAGTNEIGYDLLRTWGPVSHLMGVQNSAELREAYQNMQPEVVAFSLRLGQSEPLFRVLEAIQKQPGYAALEDAQKRVIELRIRDARHAGIGLPSEKRERFNIIIARLSQLGTDFSNHVLDATRDFALDVTDPEDVRGLPDSALGLAAQSYARTHAAQQSDSGEDGSSQSNPDELDPRRGPWRITLDLPSFFPVMQHAHNRTLREQLYRAYITRASGGEYDNTPLIDEILKLRKEAAALLGYASHAELSITEKMAGSVSEVLTLLEELRVASHPAAVRDLAELKAMAAEQGFTEDLQPWDVSFWAERLREKRFEFTEEELRPYFPLERVLNGLFALVGELFGVQIEAADGQAPIWDPAVRYFQIRNEHGDQIASFYLDPYSRPENKRGGAWMDVCIGRRRRPDGSIELPVAYLICNSTPPVGDRPSLMTFREVETLFHEFGHGLQHMLTRVEDPDVAGINGVEWDAVELPSQFMENWCYHQTTILGMTAHYKTGEPLPVALFEKIKAARTFRSGSDTLRQLRFALLDLELHTNYNPDSDETIFDVQRKVDELTTVMPPLPEDRFLCSFQHIFAGGYSAGYYSYKWAEVLSADAFSAFEEAGLDDSDRVRDIGRRFRETVLALGGSRHPMQVFVEFRGRKPSTLPLLRHSGLAA